MNIPVLHIFNSRYSSPEKLHPAALRDRVMAHLVDAFLLAILHNLVLLLFSSGRVFSIWLAPVFPLFLLQANSNWYFHMGDWWWGGFAVPVKFKFAAIIYPAIPDIFSISIYVLYFSGCYSIFAQSPGKMLRGLVLLDVRGKAPSIKLSLGYYFSYWLSIFLLGSGFLPVWGKDKTTLAEFLTGLRTVKFREF